MPAGGPDGDCYCGGSVCTKWVVTQGGSSSADATIYSWLYFSLDGQASPYPGITKGPGEKWMEDVYNCRSQLEFDVDLDNGAIIITSHIPPHTDCGGTGANVCQRKINDAGQTSPPGNVTAVMDWSIGADKIVRLQAGWRVRLHLVTDSVVSTANTPLHDLHLTVWRTPEYDWRLPLGPLSGNHGSYCPIALVFPVPEPLWSYKPCQFTHVTPAEQYYMTWPYPDDPPLGLLTDTATFPPPYVSSGLGAYDGKYKTCVMPSDVRLTPPAEHPAAPIVDRHPNSRFQAFGASGNIGTGVINGPGRYVVSGTAMSQVFEDYVPGFKRRSTLIASDQIYGSGSPEWFCTKFFGPIFSEWFEESDFVDKPPHLNAAAGWASTVWSNLAAWQCQERSTVSGDYKPALDPQPPRMAYWAYPPVVSRGYEGSGGQMRHGTVSLRPTTPTDTAWVDRQIAGFAAAFENVTFNEFALPEYPTASQRRVRTVSEYGPAGVPPTAERPYWLKYATFGYDDYGYAGPQNGCTNPGICDMETIVPVLKTGIYCLRFYDTSSPLTADGSTSVCSFIFEKPDPDNEGEWLPCDVTQLCKPDPTPDHTGYSVQADGSTGQGPFYPFGYGLYGPSQRVDKGPVCRASYPVGISTLHSSWDPLYLPWLTDPIYEIFRTSPEFVQYLDDNAADYAVAQRFVMHNYGIKMQGRLCCGYNSVMLPFVHSYCHHVVGLDDVYEKITYTSGPTSGTSQWLKRRIVALGGLAPWIVPW